MSLSRYVARFLPIPTLTKAAIKKEYYRLVWDDRLKRVIRDFYTYIVVKDGGLGYINLTAIITASTISIAARVISRLDLL